MTKPQTEPSQQLFSAHIFVFPFKWRISSNSRAGNFTTFRKKVRLDHVKKLIAASNNWNPFQFEPKPEADFFNGYNEYIYFHDYARDALGVNYKAREDESTKVMVQFEYKLAQKSSSFSIEIKTDLGQKTFTLHINSITLNFYESGVGVFAFHLENRKHADYNDILKINDYGRRIFPQFLGGHYDEGTLDFNNKEKVSSLLGGPQGAFLPLKITLAGVKNEIIEEDFSNYATRTNILKAPFALPAHIGQLFGEKFKTSFDTLNEDDVMISPVLDDRMFVMSMIFNDDLLKQVSKYEKSSQSYDWEQSDDWYRLVFVDGSEKPTIDSRNMKRELLKSSTYDRWIETKDKNGKSDGHLFGIARYSFILLTARNWFSENILRQHFSNMYFQMTLLALVQRASMLSFSAETAYISEHLPRARGLKARTTDNIADLYLQYMKFIQKIYFREVTTQEQGIELYHLLQDRLGIKSNVEDLDREMSELNQFVEAQQQRNISLITYWFFPATLILSLFGLNYFSKDGIYFNPGEVFHWGLNEWSVVAAIGIVVAFTLLLNWLINLSRMINRYK